MNHHPQEHAYSALAIGASLVAYGLDDLLRVAPLVIGLAALAISGIKLHWEWQDRRAGRARHPLPGDPR